MLTVLRSIKTSLYLIAVSVFVFLAGSIYIPHNLDVFSEVNDMPIFRWLFENMDALSKAYWIYLQVLLMAALSLNMIVCTIDSLRDKLTTRNVIQNISPHVLHIGILLVLIGHLVSGTWGYKKDYVVTEGGSIAHNRMHVYVDNIDLVEIEGENQMRWRVNVRALSDDNSINGLLEPASPLFFEGVGIYVKSADEKGRSVIGVVRDPGVKWEITGALVFILGAAGLFWSRYIKIQL
jgi:cytochrome c biogenesis factor